MEILAKHAQGFELKGDALKVAAEAKKAKQLDPSVINATIGTFYYDDGSFGTFQVVDENIKKLSNDSFYAYTASDGGPQFRKAVENWVLGDQKEKMFESLHSAVIATPGGTGAISSSIENSLDPGQQLLIPDICWSPYIGIAKKLGVDLSYYSLIKNRQFDIDGFKKAALQVLETQKRLVVILNDPCNNPTGYTLTNDEFMKIIDFLNSLTNVPCVLIIDAAYLDFEYDQTAVRPKLSLLAKLEEHVLTSICFSISKTFSCYGLRLGAQLLLSKNQQFVTEFYQTANFTARHTWSNSSKPGIEILVLMDQNPELRETYRKELNNILHTLKKRADYFLQEAEQCCLETHPYKGGFFINIPCVNNEEVLNQLRDKEKIYVLTFEKSVRIAICAMPNSDVVGLAAKIKRIITEVDGQ